MVIPEDQTSKRDHPVSAREERTEKAENLNLGVGGHLPPDTIWETN